MTATTQARPFARPLRRRLATAITAVAVPALVGALPSVAGGDTPIGPQLLGVPAPDTVVEYTFRRRGGDDYDIRLKRRGLLAFGAWTASEDRYVCLSQNERRSVYRLLKVLEPARPGAVGLPPKGFGYQQVKARWGRSYYRLQTAHYATEPLPAPIQEMLRGLHRLRHRHRNDAHTLDAEKAKQGPDLCAKQRDSDSTA